MRTDAEETTARAIRRPPSGPRFGVLVVPTAVGRDVPEPALLAEARNPLVGPRKVRGQRGAPRPSARRAATRQKVGVPSTAPASGEEVMGGALPTGEGPIDLATGSEHPRHRSRYLGWHLLRCHPRLIPLSKSTLFSQLVVWVSSSCGLSAATTAVSASTTYARLEASTKPRTVSATAITADPVTATATRPAKRPGAASLAASTDHGRGSSPKPIRSGAVGPVRAIYGSSPTRW